MGDAADGDVVLICVRSGSNDAACRALGAAMVYRIRIKGHLGNHWSDWFDGLTITNEPTGEAVLLGPIPDQATLYAILTRVQDLGLTLISVTPAVE